MENEPELQQRIDTGLNAFLRAKAADGSASTAEQVTETLRGGIENVEAAVENVQSEMGGGQVQLATAAAQDAAQTSLEAVELAHNTVREAMQTLEKGNENLVGGVARKFIWINVLLVLAVGGVLGYGGWEQWRKGSESQRRTEEISQSHTSLLPQPSHPY